METKSGPSDDALGKTIEDIVVWEPKYATGVPLVDRQHKELVSLTNRLYQTCMGNHAAVEAVFKESMSQMVAYVRFHFGAEQNLLKKIGYPKHAEHRQKHEELVITILAAAKEYHKGRKFVPNHFVRKLKDWVFGHIAIEDKIYAAYVAEQKQKGLLSDADLESL